MDSNTSITQFGCRFILWIADHEPVNRCKSELRFVVVVNYNIIILKLFYNINLGTRIARDKSSTRLLGSWLLALAFIRNVSFDPI